MPIKVTENDKVLFLFFFTFSTSYTPTLLSNVTFSYHIQCSYVVKFILYQVVRGKRNKDERNWMVEMGKGRERGREGEDSFSQLKVFIIASFYGCRREEGRRELVIKWNNTILILISRKVRERGREKRKSDGGIR